MVRQVAGMTISTLGSRARRAPASAEVSQQPDSSRKVTWPYSTACRHTGQGGLAACRGRACSPPTAHLSWQRTHIEGDEGQNG